MDKDLTEIFWANVLKSQDGHWIWQGSLTKPRKHGGYGRIMIDGKLIYATRLSYAIFHDKNLPEIEHLKMVKTCDVVECVNPAHLAAKLK